jgi:hypothetical protein
MRQTRGECKRGDEKSMNTHVPTGALIISRHKDSHTLRVCNPLILATAMPGGNAKVFISIIGY